MKRKHFEAVGTTARYVLDGLVLKRRRPTDPPCAPEVMSGAPAKKRERPKLPIVPDR